MLDTHTHMYGWLAPAVTGRWLLVGSPRTPSESPPINRQRSSLTSCCPPSPAHAWGGGGGLVFDPPWSRPHRRGGQAAGSGPQNPTGRRRRAERWGQKWKEGKAEREREREEIHSTPAGKKRLQSVLAGQIEMISQTGIFSLGDLFSSPPLPHLSRRA